MEYKDDTSDFLKRNMESWIFEDIEAFDEELASSQFNEEYLIKSIERTATLTNQVPFYAAIKHFCLYVKEKDPFLIEQITELHIIDIIVNVALDDNNQPIHLYSLYIILRLISMFDTCLDVFLTEGYNETIEKFLDYPVSKILAVTLLIFEVLVKKDDIFVNVILNHTSPSRLKFIIVHEVEQRNSLVRINTEKYRENITLALVRIFLAACQRKTANDIATAASIVFKVGFSEMWTSSIRAECMEGVYLLYKTDQFVLENFEDVSYDDIFLIASAEEDIDTKEWVLLASLPFIEYKADLFVNDITKILDICADNIENKVGCICLKVILKMIKNDNTGNDVVLESFLDQNGLDFILQFQDKFNFSILKYSTKLLLAVLNFRTDESIIELFLDDNIFEMLAKASTVDVMKIQDRIFQTYELLYFRSLSMNLAEKFVDLSMKYDVPSWMNDYYDNCSIEMDARVNAFMEKAFGFLNEQ